MSLYAPNPSDPTQTELGQLLSLTATELPDEPNNNIPRGILPNTQNLNPFLLENESKGFYSFLLDPSRGQTAPGRVYLLVVTPPANSVYIQRQVKIEILSNSGPDNLTVTYRATSLDGQPITASGATQVDEKAVRVDNAETVGLKFLAFPLATTLCTSQPLQIVKTGDRAVAQPGDTVIYRVAVRNQTDSSLNQLTIIDTLPLGFDLLKDSGRAAIDEKPVPVTVSHTGNTVTFQIEPVQELSQDSFLNLVYAAQLTPDAVRGTGQNSALIRARRLDNALEVRDGPATHRLRIDPGLLSDCGTIIGRVFEDKNFDGEQQNGEPGIANAVVLLDDGTRILTDADGRFSLANVLPGYRTGVLDPISIPDYQLAPNTRFIERNSPSRLVHLQPGGLVRMNFAVTPAHQGGRS